MIASKISICEASCRKDDVLSLAEAPEGLMLMPCQQDFEAQMDAAGKVMKKSQNALHELAKQAGEISRCYKRVP